MEDYASGVDDVAKLRGNDGAQPRLYKPAALIVTAGLAVAFSCDLLPYRVNHLGAPVPAYELGIRRLVEQRPYRRQGDSPLNPLIP
jgi:hypothetical protein